jgi:protein-disulfide isomerase
VRKRAQEKFNVDSTPTFFINGQVQKGAVSFEEMEKLIAPFLKA